MLYLGTKSFLVNHLSSSKSDTAYDRVLVL